MSKKGIDCRSERALPTARHGNPSVLGPPAGDRFKNDHSERIDVGPVSCEVKVIVLTARRGSNWSVAETSGDARALTGTIARIGICR